MMKLVLVGLVFLGAQVWATTFSQVTLEEFKLFKLQYGKTYANPTEEEFRMKIYCENREMIALHNQLYYQGLVTYTMAINQFGDMLHTEYVDRLNSNANVRKNSRIGHALLNPSYVLPPPSLDWRTQGYVTDVKNQGDCNCSYAFSTVGSIEGQQFVQTRKLISISAQNIIDCSRDQGNRGCNGGTVAQSFFSIFSLVGIESEDDYPYTGKDGECNFDPYKSAANVVSAARYDPPNEETLVYDLLYGPTSVTIDASHDSFRFYSKGVYFEEQCSSDEVNHSMLAVGYDPDGGDHWIVKNSWGESWGEKGYIKMARGMNNNCGIATDPLVAVLGE